MKMDKSQIKPGVMVNVSVPCLLHVCVSEERERECMSAYLCWVCVVCVCLCVRLHVGVPCLLNVCVCV